MFLEDKQENKGKILAINGHIFGRRHNNLIKERGALL